MKTRATGGMARGKKIDRKNKGQGGEVIQYAASSIKQEFRQASLATGKIVPSAVACMGALVQMMDIRNYLKATAAALVAADSDHPKREMIPFAVVWLWRVAAEIFDRVRPERGRYKNKSLLRDLKR